MWLFKFKLIKIKYSISHLHSHISRTQYMASGYNIGQHRYRTVSSLQKVLLHSTTAEVTAGTNSLWTFHLARISAILLFLFFEFLNFIYFLYSRFLLVIYLIHISIYMSILISQFIPPPPPHPHFSPLVSICLFSTSVSLFQPCKPVHLYHFSRFHIYVLIYDIRFSLSDLLHSVWQSIDTSTSLQMTQFRSFLWLSNIPLYICTTASLSIRLSMGI